MNFLKRFITSSRKTSYSQCGEDLIIDFVLSALGIPDRSYLDIGANHPMISNNTYLFYQQGFQGVCVEPDPESYAILKKKRKRDICLNVGVGRTQEKNADFYVMSPKTSSTFSREQAERYQASDKKKMVRVIKRPLISVNEIIQQHFKGCPHLVSIDVEGMDFDILKTFDFSRYRPTIFCVETLSIAEDRSQHKIFGIIEYMYENGYMNYADTYINTIFVDEKKWKKGQ